MKIYEITNGMEHFMIERFPEEYKPELLEKFQKYQDELQEKFGNTNMIFQYHLLDAWNHRITELEVLNIEENNVTCKERDSFETWTIDEATRQKIMELVKSYHDILADENYYTEDANYYDGYIFRIFLSDGENGYYIQEDNLQACLKEEGEKMPNARKFVSLLESIFTLLQKSGIDKQLFDFKIGKRRAF